MKELGNETTDTLTTPKHTKNNEHNKLSKNVMRICSLLPSVTDICLSLGLAEYLVAVTHECNVSSIRRERERERERVHSNLKKQEQEEEDGIYVVTTRSTTHKQDTTIAAPSLSLCTRPGRQQEDSK